MTPNPDDLEMQRNNAHDNAHRAATARDASLAMTNNESGSNDTARRVSGYASDAASSGAGALNHLRYADLNHLGLPGPPHSGRRTRHAGYPGDGSRGHHGNHGHRRHRGSLPPYRPRVVETFTAAVSLLLVAGVVACASAFPYRAALDRQADARRWEVSLARWSAARDEPASPPIARFATRPASEGVDAYVVERRVGVLRGDFEDFEEDDAAAPAPAGTGA